MNDLLIKKINPISGGSDGASVTLSNGEMEIEVFCHPCSYEAGQFVPNMLYALDAEKIQSPYCEDWPDSEKVVLSKERLVKIKNWSYEGVGKVIDQRQGILSAKGFNFNFGTLPCDDIVEFVIARVDLW